MSIKIYRERTDTQSWTHQKKYDKLMPSVNQVSRRFYISYVNIWWYDSLCAIMFALPNEILFLYQAPNNLFYQHNTYYFLNLLLQTSFTSNLALEIFNDTSLFHYHILFFLMKYLSCINLYVTVRQWFQCNTWLLWYLKVF